MQGFSISPTPLDLSALEQGMKTTRAGAFVGFEGWVRDQNEQKTVSTLHYEVFTELALQEGNAILANAIEKFQLLAAQAVHRCGDLDVGECAVWVGVTSAHRSEAFSACRFIIDSLKSRLPIWKKEFYTDGSNMWVNCALHTHPSIPALSSEAFYHRQMRLPEIGIEGQNKLSGSKILVVGVGGLGSSAALALAAAGIGTIGLVEADKLEVSNLHRQILYAASDIGTNKIDAAAHRLTALNPLIKIATHRTRLTATNAAALLRPYDLVLDCTDNFKTKYLLNDAAVLFGKPLVQASIYRFEGQLIKIDGMANGCLRCLWPSAPIPGLVGDCADVGVLGTVPMLFGTLQANEAIKHILNLHSTANDSLITFDLMTLSSQSIKRRRRVNCALCGIQPLLKTLSPEKIMPFEMAPEPMDSIATLGLRFRLIDVREEHEAKLRPFASDYQIPISRFDSRHIKAPQNAQLLVICEHGLRSLAAAELMRKEGWNNTYSLHGGLSGLSRSPDVTERSAAA